MLIHLVYAFLGFWVGVCLMGILAIAARESRREDVVHRWTKPAPGSEQAYR